MSLWSSWQVWAVLSALFAALTAIFAKVGVENFNSDFATFIRTVIILVTLALILLATGQFQSLGTISGRTYFFLRFPVWPPARHGFAIFARSRSARRPRWRRSIN